MLITLLASAMTVVMLVATLRKLYKEARRGSQTSRRNDRILPYPQAGKPACSMQYSSVLSFQVMPRQRGRG